MVELYFSFADSNLNLNIIRLLETLDFQIRKF